MEKMNEYKFEVSITEEEASFLSDWLAKKKNEETENRRHGFGLYADYIDRLQKEEKMKKRMGSFGYAIRKVLEGCKMKRLGWNGKNQYIELASNISYQRPNGEVVNPDHKMIGNCAIAFYGTSGVQVGWLASQADMLSGDWVEVEE